MPLLFTSRAVRLLHYPSTLTFAMSHTPCLRHLQSLRYSATRHSPYDMFKPDAYVSILTTPLCFPWRMADSNAVHFCCTALGRLHRTLSGILPCESWTFLHLLPFGVCSCDYLSYLLSKCDYIHILQSFVNDQIISICRCSCQCITPFIWGFTIMTFYPDKSYLMCFFGLKETFPQVTFFTGSFFPRFHLFQPSVDPMLIKGIHYIFGI